MQQGEDAERLFSFTAFLNPDLPDRVHPIPGLPDLKNP
jgi:hypothetical protein